VLHLSTKNDALKNAGTIFHQFLFGNSKFTPPSTLSTAKKPEDNAAQQKLEADRKAFEETKFNNAQNDIANRVSNVIKSTIVKYIDPPTKDSPKGRMSDYVKNAAIRDANAKLEELVTKDQRFRTILDRLWEQAAKNNYDKTSMEKIKSACISKARTLLPSVIKSTRNEALKGIGKRVKESDDDREPKRRSTPPDNSGKSANDQKGKVPARMTEEEYLLSDVDE
jgi:hypothetical protein